MSLQAVLCCVSVMWYLECGKLLRIILNLETVVLVMLFSGVNGYIAAQ
jgi:hypothetical protein